MAKNLKLKSARALLDMTQLDLANAVGVTRQTISGIECHLRVNIIHLLSCV